MRVDPAAPLPPMHDTLGARRMEPLIGRASRRLPHCETMAACFFVGEDGPPGMSALLEQIAAGADTTETAMALMHAGRAKQERRHSTQDHSTAGATAHADHTALAADADADDDDYENEVRACACARACTSACAFACACVRGVYACTLFRVC